MTDSKIILVTGASRGIGKSCALSFAQQGNHIVLMGRDTEKLNEVAEMCHEKGSTTQCISLDLSQVSDIKEKMLQIGQQHGKIDILINNAGIWLEQPFQDGDMDSWDNALDVNLKSVIHMTRYCVNFMSEGSSIFFIASIASRKSYAGGTNYCAAKFGLMGFAGSLFEDLREKGIKVCSILPGYVNTDMHASDPQFNLGKMIQADDIAQTVQFVVSMPINVCPTEITLLPQYNCKLK